MKTKRDYTKSFINMMNIRIQILTDTINDFENEIKNKDGYEKGLYKGSILARQDEIKSLQQRIEFVKKMLERDNESEEAI